MAAQDRRTARGDEATQEADVLLACAHHVQAAAVLLPEDNSVRLRLGRLATDLAEHAAKRQPKGRRPVRAA